jgi:hypothetical protein
VPDPATIAATPPRHIMSRRRNLRFLQLLADSNPQLLASEAFDLVHHRLLNIGDHVIDLFPVLLQRLLKQLPGFLDAVGYFSTPRPHRM